MKHLSLTGEKVEKCLAWVSLPSFLTPTKLSFAPSDSELRSISSVWISFLLFLPLCVSSCSLFPALLSLSLSLIWLSFECIWILAFNTFDFLSLSVSFRNSEKKVRLTTKNNTPSIVAKREKKKEGNEKSDAQMFSGELFFYTFDFFFLAGQ